MMESTRSYWYPHRSSSMLPVGPAKLLVAHPDPGEVCQEDASPVLFYCHINQEEDLTKIPCTELTRSFPNLSPCVVFQFHQRRREAEQSCRHSPVATALDLTDKGERGTGGAAGYGRGRWGSSIEARRLVALVNLAYQTVFNRSS
jgi:hypothetical protein